MTYIAPRTEALARAMCVAVDRIPDGNVDLGGIKIKKLNWEILCVIAYQFIYKHSGGELPEREATPEGAASDGGS